MQTINELLLDLQFDKKAASILQQQYEWIKQQKCAGCGNKEVLVEHHTDWYVEHGHPKSNKKGATVWICYNCHFLIHHRNIIGIDWPDEIIMESFNNLIGTSKEKEQQMKNFLEKIWLARYQPKNKTEWNLLSIAIIRETIKVE